MKSLIFTVVFCLICSNLSAKPLVLKLRPGDNALFSGLLLPKETLKELEAVNKTLREARYKVKRALSSANKRNSRLLQIQGEILEFEKRIQDAIYKLNDKTYSQQLNINALEEVLRTTQTNLKYLEDSIFEELAKLKKELREEMNAKTWGIGLNVSSSNDWGLNKSFVPMASVGLSAYWKNPKIILASSIGSGISARNVTLSWSFILSGEARISEKLSVGPATIVSQDLGDMTGADKLIWSVGPRFRYWLNDFSISMIPVSAGVRGDRGYGGNKPTYTVNLGSSVILDWFFL